MKKIIFFTILLMLGMGISQAEDKNDLIKLKLQLNALKEDVDGIKSLVSSSSNNLAIKNSKKIDSLQKRVEVIEKKLDKLEKTYQEKFKKIDSSIEKILNILQKKEQTPKKQKIKSFKQDLKKLSSKKILLLTKKSLKAKNYQKALEYLQYLKKRGYRLHEVYFLMGEVAYYKKRYDEAMIYYKKSVNINDNPPFLPKLLLHSGISLKNLGDKKSAKVFLQTLVKNYPKTKEARLAKNILKKI